jgi:hypothetical protein
MYVQDGSYAASQDRRLLAALWPAAASTGCAVTVASGMTLNVAPGSVAVPSQNNTGSTLCVSDAVEQVIIGAAPGSGTSRIDLVICRPRDNDLDGSSNTDFIFDVVAGVPAASPAVPATPAGTVALYRVTVPGGAASIVAGNLTDVRPSGLAIPGPLPASSPRGRVSSAWNPAQTDAGATPVNIHSLTVALTVGRWYLLTAWGMGNQITATSTGGYINLTSVSNIAISQQRLVSWASLATGQFVSGSAQQIFQAGLASETIAVAATSGAGALRVSPNYCHISVTDVGG